MLRAEPYSPKAKGLGEGMIVRHVPGRISHSSNGPGLLQKNEGVELIGKRSLEIVAHSLGLREIEHPDRALRLPGM